MSDYTKKQIEWNIPEYVESLRAMSDEDLQQEVFSGVLMDARASAYCRWSERVDATYDECKRRDKMWIYQRGYNAVWRSQGYEVTADMRAKARPESEDA